MLKTFRSSVHGVVAKILLGLLFLSFVVWGVDDMIRNPDRNVTLATVGGTRITSDQYARAMRTETENIRRLMGENFSPDALKNMNVSNYVLQNLINYRLLMLESQALGLIPGDVDVVRRIRANPMFQDSRGNFDKAIFESMLRNLNTSEKNYVDNLREEMGINILLDTLASVNPVSEEAAPTLLHAREEGREVQLYAMNTDMVTALPAPNAEELQAYYKDNAARFTAPELRSFRYVTMSAADVKPPAEGDTEELRNLYDQRAADFRRPERRSVEQLLYTSEESAKKAYELAKKAKSLDEVAAQTDAMNKKNVNMGLIERDKVLDVAADAVFTMKAGDVSKPVQSPFGWHVFRVASIEPAKTLTFDEARPQLEQELRQRSADDGLTTLANQVEDALAGGSTLDEAAKQFGLKVKETPLVTASGLNAAGEKAKDLPTLDKFLDTGFKTDEKTESSVISSAGGVFYVLRVEKLEPEHLRPYEEVKSQVLSSWQQLERGKKLDELAAQMSKDFEGTKEGGSLASKYHLKSLGKQVVKRGSRNVAGIALPPVLINEIFRRQLGEGTRAHAISGGTYIVAVVERAVPMGSPEKDQRLTSSLAEIRRSLAATAQSEIIDQYTTFLRNKYSVKVDDQVLATLAN